MIPPEADLDALFKRLHLANARRVWRDLIQRAERETWPYRDFLTLLVAEEIAHRQQTRLTRLVRRAHFPFLKTVDDFNFTYQSTVRLNVLGSALSPDFVTDGRSLIFGGKPGRGKTHLAVAIAYRAIQNGFDAYFTTAATLIDDLSAAFRAGELAHALPMYTHPAVLVVDEVGYLTYGTDAANMLFHVVNERHRRKRSMIFTTNKSLKGWGHVLHDDDLAQAIIDRVLERGRLVRLDGPSIRTLHVNLDDALNEGSDQDVEVARISGITRPEFPEPTDAASPITCGMCQPPGLQAESKSASTSFVRACGLPSTFAMAGDKRFVYVLRNGDQKPEFYVGLTSDVNGRIAHHNQGRCPHTASRRPWQLHVFIEFPDDQRVIRFERYLKSGSGRAFAKRHFEP